MKELVHLDIHPLRCQSSSETRCLGRQRPVDSLCLVFGEANISAFEIIFEPRGRAEPEHSQSEEPSQLELCIPSLPLSGVSSLCEDKSMTLFDSCNPGDTGKCRRKAQTLPSNNKYTFRLSYALFRDPIAFSY